VKNSEITTAAHSRYNEQKNSLVSFYEPKI